MKTSGCAALLLVSASLASCATQMPMAEVRDRLAKGEVAVKVDRTSNQVGIRTRKMEAGYNALQNGGLLGGAIGGALIAAGTEPPLPIQRGAAPEIAERLRPKFEHKASAPGAPSYALALSDSMLLVPAPGLNLDFSANYSVELDVVDLTNRKRLRVEGCADHDAKRMSDEAWRAAPAELDAIRDRAVTVCTGKFIAALTEGK